MAAAMQRSWRNWRFFKRCCWPRRLCTSGEMVAVATGGAAVCRSAASLAASALGTAIIAELFAGALLIVPAYRATGAMSAAVIWTCYLLLIVRAILQDRRDVDCGCSFGRTSRPLGAFQVVRNAVLAGVAMLIAWVSAASGSVPSQASQVLGGIALLALYGALDQVMALRPLRSGEVL